MSARIGPSTHRGRGRLSAWKVGRRYPCLEQDEDASLIEDHPGKAAGDIEARRSLALFTLAHRHYFETPERLASEWDYGPLIKQQVPGSWAIKDSGYWYHAAPPAGAMPAQGFKLHISVRAEDSEEVISRALPLLIRAETAFKLVKNRDLLLLVNSKSFARGAAGKFITIYPGDEECFLALGEALARELDGVAGPYILSDRRYPEATAVYYRYGGFRVETELTPYGDLRHFIRDGYGKRVEDRRNPYFELPPGIEDPLEQRQQPATGAVVLAGRYEPVEALSFSTSGGVYKATDQRTGNWVVVKEARPAIYGMVVKGEGIDATELLDWEGRVLKRLEGIPQIPLLIDRFQAWEHEYLVEEYVDGALPLASYRARNETAIVASWRDRATIRRFCQQMSELGLNLINAVQAVHARGVILGDLSPANILVNPDTRAIRLIDFEGAQISGEVAAHGHLAAQYGTHGYMRRGRLEGVELSRQDDWHSLSMLLFGLSLPVESFLALKPKALEDFESQLTKNANIPTPLFDASRALRVGDVPAAQAALRQLGRDADKLAKRLSRRRGRLPRGIGRRRITWERVVQNILDDLEATAEPERRDRLWPSDLKVFSTNPYSLAFGAAGPLMLFARAGVEPPKVIVERLRPKKTNGTFDLAPGLICGHSGLAWAFAELGQFDDATEFATMAGVSPLWDKDPTLFHGLAGYGMMRLRLYAGTKASEHLEEAIRAAVELLRTAQAAESGIRWICWGTKRPAIGPAYGGAGIGLFLLRLHEATGERRFLDGAVSALEAELALAKYPIKDGFPRWTPTGNEKQWEPYWLEGGAGIAAVLARFAGVLDDSRYYQLACDAAAGAYAPVLAAPGQFRGTSGIGETMLDLYALTSDPAWVARAWQLADITQLYELCTREGSIFPGRFHVRRSHDYAFGSSGVGQFLLRLARGGMRLFHDPGHGFWGGHCPAFPAQVNGKHCGHSGAAELAASTRYGTLRRTLVKCRRRETIVGAKWQ